VIGKMPGAGRAKINFYRDADSDRKAKIMEGPIKKYEKRAIMLKRGWPAKGFGGGEPSWGEGSRARERNCSTPISGEGGGGGGGAGGLTVNNMNAEG